RGCDPRRREAMGAAHIRGVHGLSDGRVRALGEGSGGRAPDAPWRAGRSRVDRHVARRMARAHGNARALSTDRAGFLWDPRLASHVYRADHPLKPRRLIGVHDLLRRIGAFDRPNAVVLEPRDATIAEIERIHSPEYIGVVREASVEPDREYGRWGLSPYGDTPPFAGMHDASLLTTGATLRGMDEVLAGRLRVSFNGAGGLHHAMRDRASGFWIYNDPAIACGLLADRGLKVAYVDIDAHRG